MHPQNKKRSRVVALSEQPTSPSVSSAVFSSSPDAKGSTRRQPPEPVNATAEAASPRKMVSDTPDPRSTSPNSLLQDSALPNSDEQFGDDERLLNEFTKLHPMLS